ncbi:porin [Marinobacter sp. SS5-14b]|uniref:porin n=1 Tax=Marinobacter sp. SS5-14b TaxID=3050456 RepID=UPI0026DFAC43|nr:porin [Marinobacter sp. SS5-14b]
MLTIIGNDMTAFGRLDFGFKDAAEKDENGSNLEEAFVGLKYGVASFSFGKQNFASDEFGIEEAIEVETIDEDRFDDTGTDGDDTIRIDIELDNVYIAASHEMKTTDGASSGIDGEYYDLFVATEVAGLELAAAYQQARAYGTAESLDTWGLSASYDFGFMNLAADYSSTDEDSVETTQYNVAAVFAVASTTDVAVGMGNKEEDNADDITEWYANVTYKFPAAKNVSVFAEIAQSDEEQGTEDADMGFLAGMRVKF